MPYADPADQRKCDARYRQRNAEFRRASRRQWNRANRPYCARMQRLSVHRRKLALHRRDGWRCHYCGKRGTMKTLTRDHKLPRKDGGPNTLTNIVSACRRCNCRKGVKSYSDFIHQIRAERGLEPLWLIEENPLALEDEISGLTRERETEYSPVRG